MKHIEVVESFITLHEKNSRIVKKKLRWCECGDDSFYQKVFNKKKYVDHIQ